MRRVSPRNTLPGLSGEKGGNGSRINARDTTVIQGGDGRRGRGERKGPEKEAQSKRVSKIADSASRSREILWSSCHGGLIGTDQEHPRLGKLDWRWKRVRGSKRCKE